MTGRFWRYVILLALFLLFGTGAEAQRKAPASRVTKQLYPTAIQEIARNNPQAVKKLKQTLGQTPPSKALLGASKAKDSERVGAELRRQLNAQGLTPELNELGNQPLLTIEPRKRPLERKVLVSLPERQKANEVLGRAYQAITRREEILARMRVKDVRPLEVLRRGNETKSQLEAHLESMGVTDYERVAASFDGIPEAKAVTFSEDVTLLRIFGGESEPIGRYMFCCLEGPGSAPVPIQEFAGSDRLLWADATGLAMPPGNLENALAKVTVPAGTLAVIGTVADNFTDAKGNLKLGGNTQVFLPHVKGVDWKWTSYHFAGASSSPSDILLEFPDKKIVRFREDQ